MEQEEELWGQGKKYRHSHPYLDHAVTVGIGDVGLQPSKQGLIVVLEVEVLQPELGVFDGHLRRKQSEQDEAILRAPESSQQP